MASQYEPKVPIARRPSDDDRFPARLDRDGTLAQRTETVVREMILDGSIQPGERLNEVTLAQSLGVSRGPVREAIQRLTSEGLVTVISHRGAFVRTFRGQDVVELYEVRAAMELHAVRLVCQRATDEGLEDLAALLRETEDRITGASERAYPQELDFHLRVLMLAGNPVLLDAALEIQRQISLARFMSAQRPIRARAAVVEHGDIVRALQERDQETAIRLMDEHLHHSMQSAISALGLPSDQEPTDDERRLT